jgi:hypothetical protein
LRLYRRTIKGFVEDFIWQPGEKIFTSEEGSVEMLAPDVQAIISKESGVGIPYPFATLNDKTKGIRLGEAILITAPEGVGKTASPAGPALKNLSRAKVEWGLICSPAH